MTLLAQVGGSAAPGDALPYSKGFLITGNYVVGGVDLTPGLNPPDLNGYSTGTIPISDPALAGGVNLVAAYLYFEAVHPDQNPLPPAADPTAGIKFRNAPINPGAIKVVTKSLSSGGATCWGSSGQGAFALSTYRANVLGLLPKQYDLQGKWTGKYIVNSSELAPDNQHTVMLREKTGDSAIQTAGATLFLVYRSLSATEPLRKIVVYDGLYTAYGSSSTPEADTMTQHLQGFYKSTGPGMRITHVVGTGGNNQTERITLTSQNSTVTLGPPPQSADPFPQTSPSSDRSWANPTYNIGTAGTPFLPGTSDSIYGETVTTTVSATNTSPAACRAWTAVFASFNVADVDADGLPDGVEDGLATKDPNNSDLPELHAMGASSTYPAGDPQAGQPHPDLFVEHTAMWAAPGTTYGSLNAPYPNTTAACYDATTKSCTDTAGHQHFLTPEDIKRVGDRYKAHNITLHVDVGCLKVEDVGVVPGCVSAYHGLGVVPHTDWVDDYTSTVADEYLVGNGVGTNVAALARGGERVRETRCDPTDPACTMPACDTSEAGCIFPDYPGSLGWRIGYLTMRNAPVADDGQELNPDLSDPTDATFSWVNSPQHRLRFDRARRPYFHYAMGAHSRGTPSSPFPCLDALGEPTDYPANSTTCAVAFNPQFHVPSSSRGLSDLPGRDVLLGLGLWDEFVGRPFAREGALFHELGHNMYLWHSGRAADFGNATTSTVIYPNCNPFILSSMSYLYSVHGLFDLNGFRQLDYSGQILTGQAETALLDGPYSSNPLYQRAWYAPASSALAVAEGVQAAGRFCSGMPFGPVQPDPAMARVLSNTFTPQTQSQPGTWSIDWNGDNQVNGAFEDTNFDGTVSSTSFSGFNDWASIRLNQISAGGLGGGTEDFVIVAHPAADELFGVTGDDLFGVTGDDLYVFTGDDLYGVTGDDLFGVSGDDLFGVSGDDLFGVSGDDLFGVTGDDNLFGLTGDMQPEPTYAGAKGLGRTEPSEISACIVGVDCFQDTLPYTATFHRVALSWAAATVGHVDPTLGYEVQRSRADVPNDPWKAVGTTTTNHLIDPAVLPRLRFIYRVRAHFDDPTGASGWAYLRVPIQALNDLPDPRPDSYVVTKNPLKVPAPGVLGVSCTSDILCTQGFAGTDADRSSDNPTTYVAQRAVVVSGPVIQGTTTPIGTLSVASNGGLTLSYPSAFVGFITFTYKANDGTSSIYPGVLMNGKDAQGNELFSGPVTVTVEVRKK